MGVAYFLASMAYWIHTEDSTMMNMTVEQKMAALRDEIEAAHEAGDIDLWEQLCAEADDLADLNEWMYYCLSLS